ncbi:hypothetical protein LINPERPRIM_LOCUS2142 [Linum perenne]
MKRINCDEWDEDLVRALFVERDVEAILKLQPPCGEEEDQMLWRVSNNGEYSVKSAYRLIHDETVANEGLRVEGEWDGLWKLDVPPKVRHWLWRSVRGVLPTTSSLRRRRIEVEDKCGLCSRNGETVEHLFLHCDVARECWRKVGMEELLPQGESQEDRVVWRLGKDGEYTVRSAYRSLLMEREEVEDLLVEGEWNKVGTGNVGWNAWCMEVLKNESMATQVNMVAVLWGLWKEQNDRVWNHTSKPERMTVQTAKDAIEDWERVQERVRGGARQVVNRDEDGELIGYKMERRNGCPPVKECEAEALVCALEWSGELGLARPVVETDSQVVQMAMKSRRNDSTKFGNIINRGRSLLCDHPRKKVKYVRRRGNTVAYIYLEISIAPIANNLLVTWVVEQFES